MRFRHWFCARMLPSLSRRRAGLRKLPAHVWGHSCDNISSIPYAALRSRSHFILYLALHFIRLSKKPKPDRSANMPPLRTARNRKPPPEGFDDIEDTLLEFANKMKDAENASHEGKKKHEMVWPVFQITHQRT